MTRGVASVLDKVFTVGIRLDEAFGRKGLGTES